MKKQEPTKDNPIFRQYAAELLNHDTIYYTCHCTGTKQYDILKEMMGDKLNYLSSGQKIII